jgi:thiol-disulfide isomerase/thioredoxin
MIALGTPAPDFELPDTEGVPVTRDNYTDHPLLVMFICNHCPYVKHVAPELARIGRDYGIAAGGELGIVAIQSNDIEQYPDDGPEHMKEEVQSRGYNFPYLLDEDQSVAKAYSAACTPDFFLFDSEHKLVYRGQLDETRPHRVASGQYDDRNGQANGKDLRAAIKQVLAGQPVTVEQVPSMGCNIKWR